MPTCRALLHTWAKHHTLFIGYEYISLHFSGPLLLKSADIDSSVNDAQILTYFLLQPPNFWYKMCVSHLPLCHEQRFTSPVEIMKKFPLTLAGPVTGNISAVPLWLIKSHFLLAY